MHELHPLVVHLPIGALLLYPWLELLGALTKKIEFGLVAVGVLGVALLGSMLASATGEAAEEHAQDLGFSHDLIETHEEWAGLTPWILAVLLVVRLWAGRKTAWGPWIGFGAGLLVTGYIVQVGSTGGKLVYEHGVGVKGMAPLSPAVESETQIDAAPGPR